MRRAFFAACVASAGTSLLSTGPAGACMAAPRAVYFSTGSSQLDDAGRATLQDFVSGLAFRNSQGSTVQLSAHTDRSGTRTYNQGLSELRAQTVRDYLAALGVPMANVILHPAGEDAPPVDTPDGVSERQNRVVWLTAVEHRAIGPDDPSGGPPAVC